MERRFSVTLVNGNAGIDNSAFQLQENGNYPPKDTFGDLLNTTTISDNPNPTKRKKSFAQLREALPRLENYRNSRRAPKRPSIGELHGEVTEINVDPDLHESGDSNEHTSIKLGWIQGVLIPCLLNIFGVMLFLRVSWVVAEAGIGESLLIIAISAVVCIITTLSLSAISTNGDVKGGGIYYIISRSLGPEFGASVGVVFAFANAVAASMNTIGFCNSLSELFKEHDIPIIDYGINDARAIGTVAIFIMILICAIGMEWESKAQNFLIAIIVIAMGDFMIGTIIGPTSDELRAKGFTGFNTTVFQTNWYSDYRVSENQNYDFFQVFAIFFPSVTGIQAGANISGDLKDPASAIPKGTFLALIISFISYAVFVFFAGGAAIRDASGSVTDLLIYNNVTACAPNCQYGIFKNYQMMTIMSSFQPLIYAGCFAATLSTALTNLLSVPRLIQALGIDRIYPGLIFFSKGYGKHGEPYRGYFLTFLVSVAFLLIGELNAIAPLISNFYLASYALINFCTFHAALIKPLGWRPTFRYYNTWLSLAGFIMCVVIMFLINWQSSLITFTVILGLFLLVVYRKPDVNWGSSTQAQTYKTALTTTQRLQGIGEHVKNYKPQILVLGGAPSSRPALIDFANLITKNNSLLICGDIVESKLQHRNRSARLASGYSWLRINKTKAFHTIVDNFKFEEGAKALLQSAGIGKLSPNVIMMGYKNNWRTCNRDELSAYFNVIHAAFDYRLSVAILRLKDGLDYSKLTSDEDSGTSNADNSISLHHSVPATLMMHVDSNLSLTELEKTENADSSSLNSNNGTSSKIANNNQPLNAGNLLKSRTIAAVSNKLANNAVIPKFAIDNMSVFKTKQNKGFIDVWWLYDDGGLTMLLPYIISIRQNWCNCKLRVFALGSNKNEMEEDEKHMAFLLSKFRLKYSSLKIINISDKPKESTIQLFNDTIKDFISPDKDDERDECTVSDSEIAALQEKTYRQLRLRELLLEYSSTSNLIVMSLPMPRKDKLSAALYMAWLEMLTKDLPSYLLVRGNQQSVLTFYS